MTQVDNQNPQLPLNSSALTFKKIGCTHTTTTMVCKNNHYIHCPKTVQVLFLSARELATHIITIIETFTKF